MRSEVRRPAFRTCPEYAQTCGPEVAELGAMCGFPPDPEQELLLNDWFASSLSRPGKSAAFECAVVAARQNIKTGALKLAALGWIYVLEVELVIWSAHEFSTAVEAFRDLEGLISGSPALARRVRRFRHGAGSEEIEFDSGQRIKFKARTATGGRGLTGDRVILDEAFALSASQLGSLMPTLAVVPDPQIVYASSAGLRTSNVLRGVRDRGRVGDAALAYIEYCDDLPGECATAECGHETWRSGCRMDDEARWERANSQLGRRMTYEYVRSERRALATKDAIREFGRERLGWWDEDDGDPVIDAQRWAACEDAGSVMVGRVVLGIDIAPDRGRAAVVAAGRTPLGLVHVEVTSRDGVSDAAEGVSWVARRVAEISAAHPEVCVAYAAMSATETVRPALEVAGVPYTRVAGGEVAAACGTFYDSVVSGQVRHVGQPDLTRSVADARMVSSSGESGWRWGRKLSGGDITPVYAATLAMWVLTAEPAAADPADNVW